MFICLRVDISMMVMGDASDVKGYVEEDQGGLVHYFT